MRKGREWLLLGATAGAAMLAGCAPGYASGVNLGVSAGPGMQSLAPGCGLAGDPVQRLSGSAGFMEFANRQMRVARIKAMNVVPTPQQRMEGWKRIATGSC